MIEKEGVVIKMAYLPEHGYVWTLVTKEAELSLVVAENKAGAVQWCNDMSRIFLDYKQQILEIVRDQVH